MQFRWLTEACVIYGVTFFPVTRQMYAYPERAWDVYVPNLLAMTAVILGYKRIKARAVGKPTWLTPWTFGVLASLSSLFIYLAGLGIFLSQLKGDPGEQGGALIFMALFIALPPSLILVPAAVAIPCILDPVIRRRVLDQGNDAA